MFIKIIIIGTGCAIATEILYNPEDQRQDVEKGNYYPLPSLNQSVYNIEAATGPNFNMVTESRLATVLDHDE